MDIVGVKTGDELAKVNEIVTKEPVVEQKETKNSLKATLFGALIQGNTAESSDTEDKTRKPSPVKEKEPDYSKVTVKTVQSRLVQP